MLKGLLPKKSEPLADAAQGAEPVDLWFHATSRAHVSAFENLRRALLVERPDLRTLVTVHGLPRPDWLSHEVLWQDLADEPSAERFFASYAPALCLWAGGEFNAGLLGEAAKRGVTLFLVEAVAQGFQGPNWRGRGFSERRILKQFDAFLSCDEDGAAMLRKLGVRGEEILVTGPMQQGRPVLPYDEASLDELVTAMGARPVWVAARLRLSELPVILEAHARASRSAHRLLLLLVPDLAEEAGGFAEALAKAGMRFSVWPDMTGLAGESAQVVLAEDAEELGLWLRAAPVAFLGRSLDPTVNGMTPYAAASLGAAILYGPNIGAHLEAYSRFAQAGGARIVRDVETLVAALIQLTAPDRAAKMAMAGWQVATEGAEVTDRVTALVHDALDQLGVM